MQQILFFSFLIIFVATAVITLLGITKRIAIHREYLKPLFSSLILELVAAVILLFTKTGFFSPSAEDFIKKMPARFQNLETGEAIASIRLELEKYPELTSKLSQLEEDYRMTRENLDKKNSEVEELEKNFLVKMAKLNAAIGNYGTSINFLWNPSEDKRAICMEVQEALSELGHYSGSIDGDPQKTHDALVRYQGLKGFEIRGFFSTATVTAMILEHLGN